MLCSEARGIIRPLAVENDCSNVSSLTRFYIFLWVLVTVFVNCFFWVLFELVGGLVGLDFLDVLIVFHFFFLNGSFFLSEKET